LLIVPSVFEKFNPYTASFLVNFYIDWLNKLDYFSEILSVGHILYTDYLVQFLLSGNILLLATIGPVVLVLNKSPKISKFQITFKQLSRTYNSVLYT
jgi:NADH:ubiquinone oxidoreductase subunit 6 (subunit J)